MFNANYKIIHNLSQGSIMTNIFHAFIYLNNILFSKLYFYMLRIGLLPKYYGASDNNRFHVVMLLLAPLPPLHNIP